MSTSSTLRGASLALLVLSTSATAIAGGNPGENPTQSKYMARSGVQGSMCAPQGTLKDLVNGKYKCYGPKGSDACGASIDAAKGKLDPKFTELFTDLMKKDPALKSNSADKDGHLYAAGCSDLGGADFVHLISVGALSYAKVNPDVVFSYGNSANFDTWGAAEREAYVAALGRYGEPQKDKILPILRVALATKGSMLSFKKNTLKLMARFNSDDGVAYCLDVLKQGTDKDVTATCGYYPRRAQEDRRRLDARAPPLRREGDLHARPRDHRRHRGGLGAQGRLREAGRLGQRHQGDRCPPQHRRQVERLRRRLHGAARRPPPPSRSRIAPARPRSSRPRRRARPSAGPRARRRATRTPRAMRRSKPPTRPTPPRPRRSTRALKKTAARTDWPKASAFALSALAQRGDKSVIPALVKLLDSPKDDVRDIALGAFGASYDTPEAFLNYVGRKGVVSDPSAVAALATFIENEPKEERREKGLRALGAVRSFLP